jgi:hypothetical protein
MKLVVALLVNEASSDTWSVRMITSGVQGSLVKRVQLAGFGEEHHGQHFELLQVVFDAKFAASRTTSVLLEYKPGLEV